MLTFEGSPVQGAQAIVEKLTVSLAPLFSSHFSLLLSLPLMPFSTLTVGVVGFAIRQSPTQS